MIAYYDDHGAAWTAFLRAPLGRASFGGPGLDGLWYVQITPAPDDPPTVNPLRIAHVRARDLARYACGLALPVSVAADHWAPSTLPPDVEGAARELAARYCQIARDADLATVEAWSRRTWPELWRTGQLP